MGAVLQQSRRKTALSADEFRWFWVTWSDDVITCGKGDQVGQDVLCSYRDHSPSAINFVGVGSAQDFSAYWLIPSQYYDLGTVFLISCTYLLIHLFLVFYVRVFGPVVSWNSLPAAVREVKQTACIRLNTSSKHICLACILMNDYLFLYFYKRL